MKAVVLIITFLLGSGSSSEVEELGRAVLQEDEAFWGRTLLRGAASMSHSMAFPTSTPPTPSPSPPSFGCDILYAISDRAIDNVESNTLSTIDIATETQTTLAEVFVPPNSRIQDIAFDLSSGALHYARSTGDNDPIPEVSTICQMDPISGEEIGCVGQFPGRITAIQFVNDILYGVYADEDFGSTLSQVLVTIDAASGEITKIGSLQSVWFFIGLAYDQSTDTLWGLKISRCFGPGDCPNNYQLYTIDLESGVATFVVQFPASGSFRAIEFGPDGKLYGFVSPSIFSSIFFRIDDIPSGEIITIFETGPGSAYGLTCGPLRDSLL